MDLLHTVANRVTSTVSSIAGSQISRRVNTALSSQSTIPSHTELVQIAQQSTNWSDYNEIISIIQSNLKLPLKMNGRLLHATLMLVETMLVHGNSDILVDCRSWVPKISELEHARLADEYGHDTAAPIRMVAARCLHLIREPEFLKSERAAHQVKNNYNQSIDSSHYSGYSAPSHHSNSSSYQPSSQSFASSNHSYQPSYSAPVSRHPSPPMGAQSTGYVPPALHSSNQSSNSFKPYQSNSPYSSSSRYSSHSPNPYSNGPMNGYQSNNQYLNPAVNSRPRSSSASQYSNTLGVNNAKPNSYYTPQPSPALNQPNRASVNPPINHSSSNDLSWIMDDRSNSKVPTLSPPPNHRSMPQQPQSQEKLFDLDYLTSPADTKSLNDKQQEEEPAAFVPDYLKSVQPVDLSSLIW